MRLDAQGTYDAVTVIVKEHSGAYGMGIEYAAQTAHRFPLWHIADIDAVRANFGF
jgi:hypothetical protein